MKKFIFILSVLFVSLAQAQQLNDTSFYQQIVSDLGDSTCARIVKYSYSKFQMQWSSEDEFNLFMITNRIWGVYGDAMMNKVMKGQISSGKVARIGAMTLINYSTKLSFIFAQELSIYINYSKTGLNIVSKIGQEITGYTIVGNRTLAVSGTLIGVDLADKLAIIKLADKRVMPVSIFAIK